MLKIPEKQMELNMNQISSTVNFFLKFTNATGYEVVKEYDPTFLNRFPFFKTCLESSFREAESHEISLHTSSPEDLDLLYALFCENRYLPDILNHESLVDPEVYEHLENQVEFFFLEQKDEYLLKIQEQIRSFPYVIANSLYENYISNEKKRIKEEGEKEKENDPKQEPFFIKSLKEVLVNCIYFKDVEEYEKNHLGKIRNLQSKISAMSTLLETNKCEVKTWNSDHYSIKPIKATIRFQEKKLIKYSKKLSEQHSTLDIKKITKKPSLLLKASKFVESDNEFVKKQAILVNRFLKIYKERILDILQFQEGNNLAEMHRKDLLNGLDLFAHYDYVPSQAQHIRDVRNGAPCFATLLSSRISCTYNLKNQDIRALEEEMRTDLSTGGLISLKKLPPVLFEKDDSKNPMDIADECPSSPEIKKLRKKLLPYFLKSGKTSKEKIKMKNPLIQLWGWDKFGITPDDFTLTVLPAGIEKKNVIRMKGIIEKFGKKFEFFFRMNEFKPIILDSSIDPTPESTHLFLMKLSEEFQKTLGKLSFDLEGMLANAVKYAKGDQELLKYINKVLMNVEFQSNPQGYLKAWRKRRGQTEEYRVPEDDAHSFFNQHFKST